MIQIKGEIGIDVTYYGFVAEVESLLKTNPEKIVIEINSKGGSSEVGRNIYDYLRSLDKPIKTIGNEIVSSSAFTIFLAGTERVAKNKSLKLLMHPPNLTPRKGAVITENILEQLKPILSQEKNKLADIYSGVLDIKKETILSLMEQDQVIDTTLALSLGIIHAVEADEIVDTGIEVSAISYINNEYKSKIDEIMDDKKFEELKNDLKNDNLETRNLFQKFIDGLKAIGKIKNIEVNTEQGVMLELEGDTLAEGVRVLNDVEDGTYTVIYNDKKWTVTIADKVITALEEVTEDEPTDDVEAYKKRIAELEEQLKSKEGLQAKFDDLEKEVAANREFVSNMKKITNKYQNEKGEFEFSDTRETAEPTDKEIAASYVEERRKQGFITNKK